MPSLKTAVRRRPQPSPWLVYILRCRDGSLYTGVTNDLPKRLQAHGTGKASRYTRSRLPVRLAYQEPQPTKSLALKREAAIKALPRAAKLLLLAMQQTGPRSKGYNFHLQAIHPRFASRPTPLRARSSAG